VIAGGTTYTIAAAMAATSTVAAAGAVPSFTTTNTSTSVSVALANHGLTAMTNSFNVPLSTSVGGVTLLGTYTVQTVPNANTFTISAVTVATSSATASMNGGNAQIEYLLPTGNAADTLLSGYGIGNYGAGNYGEGNATGGTSFARVWALDHFGQDLIASPLGGKIYYWSPPTAAPAVPLSSTAPIYNNWVFVAAQIEIVVALGAESGGTQYPLLVRWCDAGDFTDWTPSVSNQAGSFQLFSGSKLLFGSANGLTLFLWTDFGVWSVAYQGLPYVFAFSELARECGAISARSVVITAIGAVWLSAQGFFQLTGAGVQPMECPVWDFYYNNLDRTQISQITGGLNTAFHEAFWFFPMIGGGIGYVKWNWVEGPSAWDYGVLTRTAWTDASPAGNAMGVDAAGLVQQHEVGVDADGQAMAPSAQTHYFDAQQGDQFIFVDMLLPDAVCSVGATMALTVLSEDYASGTTKTDGPYLVQPNPSTSSPGPSAFVTCNSRGRQVALQVGSSDLGSSWRMGALRYRYRPDGSL
jgi:hypothetical protein